METSKKILMQILKEFSVKHTITSIAKEMGLSRVGAWKVLKKLEAERLIILRQSGTGKTNTYQIELDWSNILTGKNLELSLAEEAQSYTRWIDNFKELDKKTEFLILFGSIINTPKDANDIDLLIVAEKKNILEIQGIISRIQKSQIKQVHTTVLTKNEFSEQLNKNNYVFIDALKKGTVLFGQENLIKLIKEMG